MTYIENIFICIAAPLVVTAVCLGRKYIKYFIFGFLVISIPKLLSSRHKQGPEPK